MPEGSAKNKLQRALTHAKKTNEVSTDEKDTSKAVDIADLLAQMKAKTQNYAFEYKGVACKASEKQVSQKTASGSDSDSDSKENKANEKALNQRMMASSSLKQKAIRTMQMLMSNCVQNAFLFWKGVPSFIFTSKPHAALFLYDPHIPVPYFPPGPMRRRDGEADR